jgi:hypothetical protein
MVKLAPKPSVGKKGSVSTKSDVQRFNKLAKTYAGRVSGSKAKAKAALKSLGTHTSAGKLSKRYS